MVITSDRRRVRQILTNLIDNAIKYTDRGEVRVHLARDKNGITFTVVDSGIGISPTDLEHLFEPFRQLTPGAGPKRKGTGLGLYLSHRITENLGGRLDFSSESGGGSRFMFFLPERPRTKI